MKKNSNPKHPSLSPDKLRWHCDPARIPFETTAEVEPSSGDPGQDRALRALRMGVELTAPGYNLFVCGLSGTSRGGMIVRMIEEMHPQSEIAPEDPSRYEHDDEGPDDMPAHLRTALTSVSVQIPIFHGRPRLGTWQGIYLFEHRRRPHRREIAMHAIGMTQ